MSVVDEVVVSLNGQTYHVYANQKLQVNQEGMAQGFGSVGDEVVVREINDHDDDPEESEVILKRLHNEHPNWEDGMWLSLWVGDMVRFFGKEDQREQIINRDFVFKGKNLKGERCKIIASMTNHEVFVEMENNIGGGSCDGMGRKGHCIPIKREYLTVSTKGDKKVKGVM